jgi:hypothetical protein
VGFQTFGVFSIKKTTATTNNGEGAQKRSPYVLLVGM